MEQYLEKGKEILKILINNGCEAYLIGEAVCNIIQEIPFDEIKITTNATPEMLKGIFSQVKVEDEEEGSVRLYYSGYEFVINTFRIEEKFRDNRKPARIHYSKNLHDDLACRDFTINAIAMSYGGKLTDAYRGFEDIQKKRIRTIGNPKVRFSEDPRRILIALRFVSELGFKIENKTYKGLAKKAKLLSELSPAVMMNELKRIFNGKYFKKALKYIVESKVYKRIPILNKEFKRLGNNYKSEDIDTFLACAFVANKNYFSEWEDLSENPGDLRRVVDLAIVTPKSKYDMLLLFSYGLEICQQANKVNFLLGRAKKKTRRIKKDFENLAIQHVCDLKFKGEDILQLTSNQVGDYVQTIVDNMILKILKSELENDYDKLKIFAITSLREMGILPSVNNEYYHEKAEPDVSTSEIKLTNQPTNVEQKQVENYQYNENKDYLQPESKIDQIERRVNDYERSLREKEQKIHELEKQTLEIKLNNDVNNLVDQNLEMLKELNYIDKGTEKVLISRELKEMYRGLITNVDPKYRVLKENNYQKEGTDLKNEKEN